VIPFITEKSITIITIMLKKEPFLMPHIPMLEEISETMEDTLLKVWSVAKILVKESKLEEVPSTLQGDIIMLKLELFLMHHTQLLEEMLPQVVEIKSKAWLEMKTSEKTSLSDLTIFISLDKNIIN
jgi:hypothetical protein